MLKERNTEMKKILIICALIIASFASEALCKTTTQNGVEVKTFSAPGKNGKHFFQAAILDSFDPSGTEIFNSASGVAITSGSINTSQFTDSLTAQISVATLGSTGIDVTIYGQFTIENSAKGWVNLWTESIAATTTTSTLISVPIQEKPVRTRVGTNSTGSDATDDVTVLLLGEGPSR